MKKKISRVHPEAVESLKRYKDDLKAGHSAAAEYWRGQAGAYFTANPVGKCPKCGRFGEAYAGKWRPQGKRTWYRMFFCSKCKHKFLVPVSESSNPKPHTEVKVPRLPKCDFCGKQAQYDGKTHMGPWAYMCSMHFRMYGIGLGLGRGQKLVLQKNPIGTILPTMGQAAITGVGLGAGFKVADWGFRKLTGAKNPLWFKKRKVKVAKDRKPRIIADRMPPVSPALGRRLAAEAIRVPRYPFDNPLLKGKARSELSKSIWRKRKREGGKGTCFHCKRAVFAGGTRREGRLYHKTCWHLWSAKRR